MFPKMPLEDKEITMIETETTEAIDEFLWHEDQHAKLNYETLGERLARTRQLFRSSEAGLILYTGAANPVPITKGTDLQPVIVDRVNVIVMKEGKIRGNRINASHLNAMLKSESFLGNFPTVDRVTDVPLYLEDFSLTINGLNGENPGDRSLYFGGEPEIAAGLETINAFLNVMFFETNADRTNAVAAALTVMLHNHWPGGKPIILATGSKSHSGKDTVIAFAAGLHGLVSISYQSTDWALERSFVGAVRNNTDAKVIVVENARLNRSDKVIASAFVERFATDARPQLFSTGTGAPQRIRNDYIVAISTNFGTVSEDILNRSLPIRLVPTGDTTDRVSPIGNPKLEFLPKNRHRIAAELRGMIEQWKAAGMPLDHDVRHPFSPWAKTVGGILKVAGFTDFLANYGRRKTSDDPVRRGLGIIGASKPDEWLDIEQWLRQVEQQGLEKAIIPSADLPTEQSRRRGLGITMKYHEGESFVVETDRGLEKFKLELARKRDGGEPKKMYRFVPTSVLVDQASN
jgi:hypothetical protein